MSPKTASINPVEFAAMFFKYSSHPKPRWAKHFIRFHGKCHPVEMYKTSWKER